MKKILSIAAMAILCFTAKAQINKTYMQPNRTQTGGSIALLNKNSTKEMVVSSHTVNFTTNTNFGYNLVKLDANGTPMASLQIDTSWGITKIKETYDSCVLVVTNYPEFVVAQKYDANLTQLWSYQIPIIPWSPYVSNNFAQIDVECIQKPHNPHNDREDYYIICTSGANDTTSYPDDNNVSVIKIDELGNLIWHKVYSDQNRATNGAVLVSDMASSITSFRDHTTNQLFLGLAGTRNYFYITGHLSTFYMVIDENGIPVTPYKDVLANSAEQYAPDIIYDGDSLVATYIQEGTSQQMIPSFYGIWKTDVNLMSFRGREYWTSCENVPRSITMSSTDSILNAAGGVAVYGTDKNYLIGGFVSPCTTPDPYRTNPAFLKIDKITLDPIQFARYNVNTPVYNNSIHRTDGNDNNYMLASTYNTTTTPGDARVIKTLPSLLTCGRVNVPTNYVDLTPSVYDLDYQPVDYNIINPFSFPEYPVNLNYTDCYNSGVKPEDYREEALNVSALQNTQAAIAIYPTKVMADNREITCSFISQETGSITVAITNTVGQVVAKEEHKFQTSTNDVRINVASLATGLYIVHVSTSNGLKHTAKIVVER